MMKYVDVKEVFAEIPDEITLAISISGCPIRCPGCHSQFLWGDIGEPLTEDALTHFIDEYGDDMTCIAFMGGDAEPERVDELARFLHDTFPKYKVAWYSGRIRIPREVKKADFDYIKVGPYLRHLGSLREPTTNQRLYRRKADNTFEDITSRFWK